MNTEREASFVTKTTDTMHSEVIGLTPANLVPILQNAILCPSVINSSRSAPIRGQSLCRGKGFAAADPGRWCIKGVASGRIPQPQTGFAYQNAFCMLGCSGTCKVQVRACKMHFGHCSSRPSFCSLLSHSLVPMLA